MNDEELFKYVHFNTLPPKEVKISTRTVYNRGKKVTQITKKVDGVTTIYFE